MPNLFSASVRYSKKLEDHNHKIQQQKGKLYICDKNKMVVSCGKQIGEKTQKGGKPVKRLLDSYVMWGERVDKREERCNNGKGDKKERVKKCIAMRGQEGKEGDQ